MTDRDHLDPALAAGLEQHLAARIRQDTQPVRRDDHAGGTQHRTRRTAWVTGIVGVLVLLLAVVAIRATSPDRSARPAEAPTASQTDGSPTGGTVVLGTAPLLHRLPKPAYGRLLHTWTESELDSSGPFDLAGDTLVIAGICNGGGAVSLTDVDGKPHTLSCRGLQIQQPFWRLNLGGDGQPTATVDPVQIHVRVLQGSPRFVVRAWAVDPRILRSGWYIAGTGPTVPAALRTCQPGDLAPTGTLEPVAGEHVGLVTLTNRSSSACAVRDWPTMHYLDRSGNAIGGDSSTQLDSREGQLNRYHEFPPARLTPGGHGYLLVDLPTETELRRDDQQQAAADATASPLPGGMSSPKPCDPTPIMVLTIALAGNQGRVPLPAGTGAGACQSGQLAFGVNPVVATRPVQQ